MLAAQAQGQVEHLLLLTFGNQNQVEHTRAMALEKRQAAGKEKRALPALTQLEKIRRIGAGVAGDVSRSVDASQHHRLFVAPGEASAKVCVPGITGGGLLGSDLDAHFEN